MQATMPALLDLAEVALHPKDWLYLNLTGQRATDPSEANFTFGNFRTRRYEPEVIAALGLTGQRHLLPEIVDGSQTTHALTARAAGETGLLAGTPVSLGYVDVVCTALGAGIHTGGALPAGAAAGCTIIGSTGMHMMAKPVADVVLNAEGTGYVMVLPIAGMTAQIHSNMAATLNIDWVLNLAAGLAADLGQAVDKADLLARIDGWLAASTPGALMYHPYISEAGERGPFVDSHARASFIGLNATHRFADLVRAVIEGLGLAARDCYTAMGAMPAELRLTGGAARSRGLRSVLAAAIGAPTRVSACEEAGAAGAARMAAVANGHYASMDACIADWVTPLLGPAEPADPDLCATYAALYPTYRTARRALTPVWAGLAHQQDH
jgi:erythritol kinase (D-erythritol 1-phosphate-forming)